MFLFADGDQNFAIWTCISESIWKLKKLLIFLFAYGAIWTYITVPIWKLKKLFTFHFVYGVCNLAIQTYVSAPIWKLKKLFFLLDKQIKN